MEVTRMNKSSISLLAKAISSKRGLKQAEAERFIAKMFEVANQALDDDKQLKVRWLGTFKVAPVKDRESVDVNTGERIVIEGRDKISFTPDNILKEIINKPFAQFETVVVNDGVDFSDIDEKFAQMKDQMKDEEMEALGEPNVSDEAKVDAQPSDMDVAEEIVNEAEVASPSLAEEQPNQSGLGQIAINLAEASDDIVADEAVAGVVSDVATDDAADVAASEETTVVANDVKQEDKAEEKLQPTTSSESATLSESDYFQKLEEEEELYRRHFVIPKYMVAVVCVLFVALLGGMGWFAFNYGKIQAQYDHLAAELAQTQLKQQKEKAEAKKIMVPTAQEDSVQAALKAKAREDSIRMAASSEAVRLAEKKEQEQAQAEQKTSAEQKVLAEQKAMANADAQNAESKYDSDPRVRTGAYRIVGVAQTVTVSSGQTIASLSKRYLGAGMECYIEAINGTSVVKEGQKIKIPKLELKRKSKK